MVGVLGKSNIHLVYVIYPYASSSTNTKLDFLKTFIVFNFGPPCFSYFTKWKLLHRNSKRATA